MVIAAMLINSTHFLKKLSILVFCKQIKSKYSTYRKEIQLAQLQMRCIKWNSIDSTCVISSLNPMFDHFLESSRWDDSNKWSNIGFGEEMGILDIKVHPYLESFNLNLYIDITGTCFKVRCCSKQNRLGFVSSYRNPLICICAVWLCNLLLN